MNDTEPHNAAALQAELERLRRQRDELLRDAHDTVQRERNALLKALAEAEAKLAARSDEG